jgi:hypothetical protein
MNGRQQLIASDENLHGIQHSSSHSTYDKIRVRPATVLEQIDTSSEDGKSSTFVGVGCRHWVQKSTGPISFEFSSCPLTEGA